MMVWRDVEQCVFRAEIRLQIYCFAMVYSQGSGILQPMNYGVRYRLSIPHSGGCSRRVAMLHAKGKRLTGHGAFSRRRLSGPPNPAAGLQILAYRNGRPLLRSPALFPVMIICSILFSPAMWSQQERLSLRDAIALSLQNSERTLASLERIDAAEARVWRARSMFLPTISLTGIYQRRPFEVVRSLGSTAESVVIQRIDALSATMNASLMLFDARTFPLFAQARSDRDANVSDAMNTTRLLKYEVANAFLQVLSMDRVLQAAQQRHAYAESNREAAHARYAAQIVGVNDVTRADLELATAERELTNARGARETASLQLEFLVNADIQQALEQPVELQSSAEHASFDASALLRVAREHRPDLLAAQARANAQHAYALEALLRLAPAVSANAQYRATNEAGLSGKSTSWYVGATLSWNVFDGGLWVADRNERVSNARAADYQAQEIMRKVRVDIRSALVALTNAQAALKQSSVALEAARKNAAESTELYKQGLASALEAADANVRLFEAEVGYASANYNVIAAFLGIRQVVGIEPFDDIAK